MITIAVLLYLAEADLKVGSEPTDTRKHLRRSRFAPQQQDQNHRSLLLTRVPFTFKLRMKTNTDREPAPSEYNGVEEAVETWADNNNEEHYNETDPLYISTSCVTAESTYDPNAEGTTPNQIITLNCEVVFAANDADVPTSRDYVWYANANYALSTFIVSYLYIHGPTTSVFKTTSLASIALLAAASPPIGDNQGDIASRSSYVIPARIQFDLAVGGGRDGVWYTDRDPTDDEYEDWFRKTEAWIIDSLENAFNRVSSTSHFNRIRDGIIVSKSHTSPNTSTFPHTIVIQTDLEFRLAPENNTVDWVSALKSAGLIGYRRNYLHQLGDNNVFKGVRSVKWEAIEN